MVFCVPRPCGPQKLTSVSPHELFESSPEYSVSALSSALKRTLESTFGRVRVKGEISGAKLHTSGHLYFTLKDDQAVLDAVCWRGTVSHLAFKPTDGLEVLCQGRITIYPGRSKYQIVVESLSLTGEGALLKLLEQRKQKLREEGLFDATRKKPLPFFPAIIGVITSPTGAVIRDILHRLEDRLPRTVYLWPVTVQGETAAAEMAAAITGFNALTVVPPPDVLIVARGGGSFEDLWAFNEESVVRAVAASRIPVISAVGHETDTTLIDYAADRRAPTPSAAAEMAVPVRQDLLAQLTAFHHRLDKRLHRLLQELTLHLRLLAKNLPPVDRFFEPYWQRLDDRMERLVQGQEKRFLMWENQVRQFTQALRLPHNRLEVASLTLQTFSQQLEKNWAHFFKSAATRLHQLRDLLESVSYARTLARGFSLTTTAAGKLIHSVQEVQSGDTLKIILSDGMVATRAL